jgi:hypothetical protein
MNKTIYLYNQLIRQNLIPNLSELILEFCCKTLWEYSLHTSGCNDNADSFSSWEEFCMQTQKNDNDNDNDNHTNAVKEQSIKNIDVDNDTNNRIKTPYPFDFFFDSKKDYTKYSLVGFKWLCRNLEPNQFSEQLDEIDLEPDQFSEQLDEIDCDILELHYFNNFSIYISVSKEHDSKIVEKYLIDKKLFHYIIDIN